MKINFLKRKKEFGFTIEIIKEMKERVLFYVLQSLERLHVVEGTAGYPLQFVVMQKPEKPNKNMCMLMNHNNLLFIENQWVKHFFFFEKKGPQHHRTSNEISNCLGGTHSRSRDGTFEKVSGSRWSIWLKWRYLPIKRDKQ